MPTLASTYRNRQPDGSWINHETNVKTYEDVMFAHAVAHSMATNAEKQTGGKLSTTLENDLTTYTVAYGYKGDTEYIVMVR